MNLCADLIAFTLHCNSTRQKLSSLLQMSKEDPRGEFTGPQSQQARGRAEFYRDSGH